MVSPLRIFIASPGDVNPERLRAALLIEKLAKDYARFFEIGFIRWELEPMLASGNFQDHILTPAETDIFVMILWSRLGSPLPERTAKREYRGLDGRVPVTGTEWEFENALVAERAKGVPDLLAYRKGAPPEATYRSKADLAELGHQWEMLDAFWQRYFVEFRAAFREFEALDEFEAQLENDLRHLIERRIASRTGATSDAAAATWLKSSPFRGLDAYLFEHAPIFFGRTKETKDAVEQLVANAEAGRAFLLILGASGTGKSSLAQAGVVPSLSTRGFVNGVGAWCRAVVRPASHPGGPFAALAQALTGEEALPELLAPGQDAAALARHLAGSAQEPAYPIVTALSAREHVGRKRGDLLSFEEVRLALVVDQLEELFTMSDVTPEQRRSFILCLDGLARSGRIYAISTMRSDYWHRAAEVPLLVEMAAARGRLDLLPASQAEIAEMIRRPAEAAGLTLETHPRTEIRLDAALAEEAASAPGALPLLSFLLDALYARDVTQRAGKSLTYSSMEALGGLTGAIKERAETAFGALPPEIQAALSKVLRALVTVSRSGAEPTARVALFTAFREGTPERRLVEAFLAPDVRLLVAEGDGVGARIRVAHEALLTHWERARQQIAQDRDDLRTRAVAEEAQAEWQVASGEHRRALLLRNPRLAAALDLAARWREGLSADVLNFIALSDRAARTAQQRRWIAAVSVMAVLVLLAAVSAIGLYIAETQRNGALSAQSRFLARDSRLAVERGDAVLGMQLALEALPKSIGDPDRPFVASAEYALENAVANQRERVVLGGHGAVITSAAYSPDGSRIVTGGDAARIWDAKTGAEIVILRGHKSRVISAAFSPDGTRVVTASADKTARIWDAKTGVELAILQGHEQPVVSATFSPDGTRIATAAPDTTARIWDAGTGAELFVLRHGVTEIGKLKLEGVRSASFSPDGTRVVTAADDKTARIWDAKTGAEIAVIRTPGWQVLSAAFSPDGTRVLTVSLQENAARLWDAKDGTQLVALGGGDNMMCAAYSPDGTRVVTGSVDRTARIWDAKTGAVLAVLRGHEAEITSAAFSPDGTRVVTASSDQTARIWDAMTGVELAVLRGQAASISSAAFSPDGARIVTASRNGGAAHLWDVKPNDEIAVLRGHTNRVFSAVLSPDGARIVTASADKTARIWDAKTGIEISVLRGHGDVVDSAVFSPDGSMIVTASRDKTARIWGAKTGGVVAELRGHGNEVTSVMFSPDSRRVVTASGDTTARVWDAQTGIELAVLRGHGDSVQSAVFSPDGSLIATASLDKTARIWDAKSGKEIVILRGHEGTLGSIAFSPDGARVVTGSLEDSSARLWDVKTGKELATLRGHLLSVTSAEFSPDGTRVVTAATDGTVRIWDAMSGAGIAILMVGGAPAAALSLDGTRIVVTTEHGTASVWDVSTGSEIIVLHGHEGYALAATFSPDGTRIATASSDTTGRVWQLPVRCQALIDAGRASLPRPLSEADRKGEFLAESPQSPLMRIYLRLRPAFAFALPMGGDRCE